MSRLVKQRINSIDILRFFAAFAVLLCHCSGFFGELPLKAVCMSSVPVFFMISGYFFFFSSKKSQAKSIKRILLLTVISNIFFFLYKFALSIASHKTSEFFSESFSLKKIIDFLVFNDSPFAGHLWFLSALLYTMIVCYFISKLKLNKILILSLAILLILIDTIFGSYGKLLFNISIDLVYLRNFIFAGIPYFLLGALLKKADLSHINKFLPIVLLVLFCATCLFERNIFELTGLVAERRTYISTVFIALSAFVLALIHPCCNTNGFEAFLSTIGRKYSLSVYIIHPIVRDLLNLGFKRLGEVPDNIYKLISPIIILIVSVALAYMYYKFKEFLLTKIRKN